MPQAHVCSSGEAGIAPDAVRPPSTTVKIGPEILTPILHDALYRQRVPMPALLATVGAAALRAVIDESLPVPKLAYAIYGVAAVEDRVLILSDGTPLPTRERLAGVERVAAAVCGIGRSIDLRAAAALAAGKGRFALALDLIGTHALFRLSDYVRDLLRESARNDGLTIGGPLEPGMENFPLREEGTLLRLADAEPMGFYTTSLGAIGPGRVLTFAVPIGRNLPPWRPADRCLHCPSRKACHRMGMAADE